MAARTGAASRTMHTVLTTRLGELTVVQEEGALIGLYFPGHWPRPDRSAFGPRVAEGTAAGFAGVADQLDQYLAGERTAFELQVLVNGTEFDRRVWDLVSAVPYGQTTTYGDLGRSLGPGTDPRATSRTAGRRGCHQRVLRPLR